ncbi:M15 family metallopeptidase [Aurantimonas sp. 22II-16-19i]|uniref:M15 family metallopeptidase n=1 Tax=Aurantimonas sp. 22II-16-19i TaxID=1317114 RepID=UPI0009F7C319|nr:M15 family metallopeptidase [Aurantimonas sp. 22II-16-19i]ORE90820.1 NLP/P60 protein [Aurantimonas sp. 22II-16-19i]
MATLALGCAALLLAGSVLAPPAGAASTVPLFDRLEALRAAFPAAVRAIGADGMVMADGSRIAIDDGAAKDHEQKLANADLEDMLSQIYPIGVCDTGAPPSRNFDPGRIRNDAFFRSLYGSSPSAAQKTLVSVDWFGSRLPFTATGGADEALVAVARDLASQPALRDYLTPSAGTFNWRVVAGTKRLSAHSFGAAIDVNTRYADYWLWSGGKPGNVPRYRNRLPKAVVAAFERHGFIWGGKWYHYDTMHFEYRPELIAIGRLAESRGCPQE